MNKTSPRDLMIMNVNVKTLAEIPSRITQTQLALAEERKESLFLTGQSVWG